MGDVGVQGGGPGMFRPMPGGGWGEPAELSGEDGPGGVMGVVSI